MAPPCVALVGYGRFVGAEAATAALGQLYPVVRPASENHQKTGAAKRFLAFYNTSYFLGIPEIKRLSVLSMWNQ